MTIASTSIPDATNVAPREVVFVDSRVQDVDTLLQGFASGVQVVYLHAGQDGLAQMAAALGEQGDVAAVHVLAHGSAGRLWLGGSFLDASTLAGQADALAALGRGLTADGDLLVYACDLALGEVGAQFVSNLAALTGADVAASDNRTGAGGDWALEMATGHIAGPVALTHDALAAYGHALATWTVTTTADSGVGSLRNGIENANDGDTIVIDSSLTALTLSSLLSINKNLTLDLSGVTLNGGTLSIAAGKTLTVDNGAGTTATINTALAGDGGLVKSGAGTLTLAGNNTNLGSTSFSVSEGTLALSGGAAMDDASAVTVSSGATLSLNASETLGSLAGAGSVSLNGFTLSSGGNNASTTFSGVLDGSGGFTKTGSGTLILSGSNSGTFSGGTTVSGGGTLSVASDANLGSGTLSINNSTLGITGATTIDNSIALTNGAKISNTAAVTLSNAISGSGSLYKAGSGVLALSGTSNYGGSTTVSAGTLSVTGALNDTSAVSVSSGATLTGSGSVTNLIVSSGGTLSPGNSPGVFTVNGNLQMNAGSTLAVEINGVTAGADYDQVIVNGTVSFAGNLMANMGYLPGQGDVYTIIDNDMADPITGTFSGLAEGATITAGGNGSVLTASYSGGTGNDVTLTAPVNAAPTVAIIPTDYYAIEQVPINLHGTGISVGDVDGNPLTVTMTGAGANSNLAANVGSTGVVIVSGVNTNALILSGTVAQLNALFTGSAGATLTYRLSGDTPVATRLLTISASDGSLTGSDTATVNITAVNDAPANTVPGAQATMEDAALVFSAGNGNQIQIDDVDAGSSDLEITLAVTNGTLTLAGTTGLSFSVGDGTTDGSMTFTGTQSDINTALATLTFNPTANFNGSATLSISTNDQGNTGSGGALTVSDSVSITVNPTNDAPTVAHAIPDGSATAGTAFNYQFAANTFADMNVGDTLTYSAQLAGGGALPAWLSFDPVTRTFSGTPTGTGTVSIDVIADDSNGGSVTDTFDVVIGAAPVIIPPEPEPPVTPPTPGIPDNDGIPTAVEDQAPGLPGPNGTTVAGDGNGDGIKDSAQAGVASMGFHVAGTAQDAPPSFTTLVASSLNGKVGSANDNARITSLQQLDAPAHIPEGMEIPLGLVAFTVELAQGKTGENFSLYVDPALGVNGYWKQDASGQWVNLASEPYGGKTVMEGGKLRLDFHIEDGGQFDADGKVDGIITDPGAPAHMPLSIMGQAPDMPHGFWF